MTFTLDDETMAAIADRVARLLEAARKPEPEAPRFLTVPEAARYLGCSRQRVYDLCSQRSLTRFKDGSRVLLDRTEIDAYLANRATYRR